MNHRVYPQIENGPQMNGGVIRNRNQPREPIGDFERRRYSQRFPPALNIGPRKTVRNADRAPGNGGGEHRSGAQNLQHPRVAQFPPAHQDARWGNDLRCHTEVAKSGAQSLGKTRHTSDFASAGDQNLGGIFRSH